MLQWTQNATDRTYIGEGSATENADGTPAVYTVLNSLTFEAKTPGSDKNGYKFVLREGTAAQAGVYPITLSNDWAANNELKIDDTTLKLAGDYNGTTAAAAENAFKALLEASALNAKYSVDAAADGTMTLTQKQGQESATAPTVAPATGVTATAELAAEGAQGRTEGRAAEEATVTFDGTATTENAPNGTITYVYANGASAGDAATKYNQIAGVAHNAAAFFTASGSGIAAGNTDTPATLGTDNSFTIISSVIATASSQISNVQAGVKYGSYYTSDTGTVNLFKGKQNINGLKTALGGYTDKITINTYNAVAEVGDKPIYVQGKPDADDNFAKTGSYTVVFTYIVDPDNTAKDSEAKSNLTLTNSIYIPEVDVPTRKVDSLDPNAIKDVLKASVDMNNNTSNHESITGFAGLCTPEKADGTPTAFANVDYTKTQTTIKYVIVEEDGINFYIPKGTTFYTE